MDEGVVLRDRVFPAKMVRGICEWIYKGTISRSAWTKWREWAKVSKESRSYTFEQFCFLYAVASIRAKEENRYRELWGGEVEAIAKSLETEEALGEFVRFFDSQYVVGKDAPRRLAHDGVRVSARTLYRNVPGFNMNKIYQVDHLKEWAIA